MVIHKLTKDGSTIFPATITDAVVHPNTGRTLTSMMKDYNISELFPSEGIDGGNRYNLTLALQVLGTHLTAEEKTGGIKVIFISNEDPYPLEEYFLRTSVWSTNEEDWRGLDKEPTLESHNFVDSNSLASVYGSYETEPEYIGMSTDGEDRILEATKFDGTKVICTDLVVEGNTVCEKDLTVNGILNAETKLDKTIYFDEDPEGRLDIKEDAESYIVSYRDETGTLHEEAGIKTSKLELTGNGMTDFQKALKESGFTSGAGDWSDSSSISIPIPRCAIANITNSMGTATWPTAKGQNLQYYLEFWDMQGNYFKKEIIFNAQGNSSMAFIKKNGAADFTNNNGWDDSDTFSIKFGDWVPQDSFHFKAYYTDYLRGSCVVAYQFADDVYKSRGVYKDRPWKEALIDFDKIKVGIPANYSEDGISDTTLQIDTGARCMPDGFPCIFYLNGEFYGIYSWQLKKHRDNYHMNRNNKNHIHLDGDLTADLFWNPSGGISWDRFEVRNPKPKKKNWTLYCQDGSVYDGDNPKELMGSNSPYYSEGNQSHVYSASVKESITNLSYRITSIKGRATITTPNGNIMLKPYQGVYNSQRNYGKGYYVKDEQGSFYMSIHSTNTGNPVTDTNYWINVSNNISQLKSYMETYFDIDNLIDYEIINMATGDPDGFGKNWQWTTWDGTKWYVNQYDKDMSFGNNFLGVYTTIPYNWWLGDDMNTPIGWITVLYRDDIIERWNSLVSSGILTSENIISKVMSWVSRFGISNFEKEWEKWPESPCNRDSGINYQYWEFYPNGFIYGLPAGENLWNENVTYAAGDTAWVFLWDNQYVKFESVADNNRGNHPIIKSYTNFPTLLGYRDSVWRFAKYIEQNISGKSEFINSLPQ